MTPIEMLLAVSGRLAALPRRIAYLGGATTGLLLTDPAASAPRATLDVDAIVDVRSRVDYQTMIVPALRALGAREDDSENAPLCRWILEGVRVDVMPTDPAVLGFANRWYPSAVASATAIELPDGSAIRVVDGPHFLATKIEAFRGRGRDDFAASKDIEDIVALVDGRPELVREVESAAPDLRRYLADAFGSWCASPFFVDALPGHLPANIDNYDRAKLVEQRLRSLSATP